MGMIFDRNTQKTFEEEQYKQYLLEFLYNNVLGRIILKCITRPMFSKIVGKYNDSFLSKRKIKKFVQINSIDMSKYEDKEFRSFNDFFTRKKKKIIFSDDKNILCSPADSKLMVYKITDDLKIKIKHSIYSLSELLKCDENILENYKNGNCFVFRLAVDDYHRYHYIDNGKMIKSYYIKGKLHTVRSISEKYNVYVENCRVCSLISTENFGEIYEVEVGAILVGKIINHKVDDFKKGQEKGYFEYGGSTVLLITKNNIKIDDDILNNSEKDIETKVSVGDKIGKLYFME